MPRVLTTSSPVAATESPGAGEATAAVPTNDRLWAAEEAEKQALPRRRVVACGRVSTEKQLAGTGTELQEAKFARYAQVHDVELVKVFSDALSGKTMDRPGLQEALAMLERGEADDLLITKVDRLTRNVADLERLLDLYFASGRFGLLSTEEHYEPRTADGRFLLRLYVILGQLERERLVERTTDGLAQRRATGGGTPRVEGAAVARIVALQQEGRSLREIAQALTDEGVPTLKGGKWANETVRKVLARARANGGAR